MHAIKKKPAQEVSRQSGLSTVERKSQPYKVVVLGDGGVGKSALTMQFVASTFVDVHDPTIEDAYRQQCIVDGVIAHLDILDTAGQREFTAMREQYMRTGEGFLLCYSITDRRSFGEIAECKRLIDRVRCGNSIPMVLVGNKCDLVSQRVVSVEEGKSLASKIGCPFLETSAAQRQNVDEIFHTIIRQVRLFEQPNCDSSSKKRRKGFAGFLQAIGIHSKKSS